MPNDTSPGLLTCDAALLLIAEHAANLACPTSEVLPLAGALGRVLAADLHADRDQPPFARSTRDGYAVRAADLQNPLTLVGAIRAGEQWTGKPMEAGQTIEIMTGAPVPQDADAVLMLEHVRLNGMTIHPERALKSGENIVPQAAEARAGDVALNAGVRLGPAEIALAASIGAGMVPVYAKPTVAILATGDELVDVAATPGPMQIRNSNSHGLAALVLGNGGVPQVLPPAADTLEALRSAIVSARNVNMLLLSGGVSAGKYDFVEDVLLSLGAEFFFTGVKIQPGKPAVFGRIPAAGGRGEQWIFGLPGNPVSTQVTATLFAMPLLRALGGEQGAGPVFAQATLAEDITVRPGLTRFLPARTKSSLAGATVKPTGWQGSGDLHSNARANCYLIVPPDRESLKTGEVATVLLR